MARLSRVEIARPKRPTVTAAVDIWLTALDAANRSPLTLRNYREAIAGFTGAVGNPLIDEVSPDDIRRFLLLLREAKLKPATALNRYRALNTFFRWCEREGLVERPPTAKVDAPQLPQTEPVGYTRAELLRLVASCDTRHVYGARDRAVFLTLAGTALRVSELCQLRRADVVRESVRDQYIRVRGKGNKERLVSLTRVVREAIGQYLLLRGEDDDPALWIGERGELKPSGIREICYRRGKNAGVTHCHPHRFRNTGLSLMLDAGLDRGQVMRLAGHTSENMLRRYTGYAEQRRANDALLEKAPLDGLDWASIRRKKGKAG